jgi:hypothetical protein
MTPGSLPSVWRTRAALLAPYAPAVARAFAAAARELEDAFVGAKAETLGLHAAARYSGYSADHLRRLVRLGRLPAERRGRQLLFHAGDLPRKPRSFDDQQGQGYDPVADARQVAAVRSRGGER